MLERNDIAFFARRGYLQVPGVLAPDDCRELVEESWRVLPPAWSRDDPSSWHGDVTDSCHRAPLEARSGLLKYQRGTYRELPVFERAFGAGSAAMQVAADLLGPRLAPMHHRGLYIVAPKPGGRAFAPPHHIEAHPAHLIALGYLEDVRPGAGGLLVWPGSHRVLYPLMGSKLEHVGTPAFEAAYARCVQQRPVELPGRRGDAVYIHHRLIHAPSRNISTRMRFAFLCDYLHADARRLCAERPSQDLWEDWEGVAQLPPGEREPRLDWRTTAAAARGFVRKLWPAGRREWKTGPVHPSKLNTAQASELARARAPGDVWIVVSDSRTGMHNHKLKPRGGELVSRGLRVTVGGAPLASQTHNAFIARVPQPSGALQIEVQGVPCEVWIKVVAVRLPFEESIVAHSGRLAPGEHRLQVALPEPVAA